MKRGNQGSEEERIEERNREKMRKRNEKTKSRI